LHERMIDDSAAFPGVIFPWLMRACLI